MEKPSVRPIKVMEWIDKVGPLLEEHWSEVAMYKHLMVLKPNAALYQQLEEADRLISLGAFVGDELVGYSVTMLLNNPHYSDLVQAMNDVVFVAKAHRHGRLGLSLIHQTEIAAKERGARLLLWHVKQNTALEQLLPRVGYDVFETILSKEL